MPVLHPHQLQAALALKPNMVPIACTRLIEAWHRRRAFSAFVAEEALPWHPGWRRGFRVFRVRMRPGANESRSAASGSSGMWSSNTRGPKWVWKDNNNDHRAHLHRTGQGTEFSEDIHDHPSDIRLSFGGRIARPDGLSNGVSRSDGWHGTASSGALPLEDGDLGVTRSAGRPGRDAGHYWRFSARARAVGRRRR